MSLLMVNVPADSWTTWPGGHALIAAWMTAVASPAGGFTVAHTVDRAGIPPGRPGFHAVLRSSGRIAAPTSRAWARMPIAARLGRREDERCLCNMSRCALGDWETFEFDPGPGS